MHNKATEMSSIGTNFIANNTTNERLHSSQKPYAFEDTLLYYIHSSIDITIKL